MNKKGFSLIEMLIVIVIGFFIMEAAYLLYTGSIKLFRDVRTKSDNLETKMPSIELIGRYFESWGTSVYSTDSTTVDCTNFPPSDQMCIKVTDATPCDEVTYWGNINGIGFVKGVNASDTSKMDIMSCRLNTDSGAYYVWRGGTLQTISSGSPVPVTLTGLGAENISCSTATSTNTTLNKNIMGSTLGDLKPGDVIQRAPYKIRLYCASNSSDNNSRWLYVEQTDTISPYAVTSEPIAPVDSFQVQLLPASSVVSGTCIECMSVKVTVSFRSQSKTYSRETKNLVVERIFGR